MGLTEKMFVLGLGLLIIILLATKWLNRNDALKHLKEKYEAALQGYNREEALEAGRAYYRSLRGRELTAADEQNILEDIAHMPETDGGDLIS